MQEAKLHFIILCFGFLGKSTLGHTVAEFGTVHVTVGIVLVLRAFFFISFIIRLFIRIGIAFQNRRDFISIIVTNVSLLHMLEIADQYVSMSMKIGFHAHNNRQMAYSNALSFVEYNSRHDMMLDASIMGMGKGAGNLCTELIEATLLNEGKDYNSTVIYETIAEYFAEQQKKTPWGYSLDYYLSSLYSCTPSYIKIFT